jgi:nitroreductase
MREWEFILIMDKGIRLQAARECGLRSTGDAVGIVDSWGLYDKSQREMYIDAIPKQRRMLVEAGCLVIPLYKQHTPLLKPASLSDLNGFASIWCCIENMLLAAAGEGIQGVTRIPFDHEAIYLKELLKVPKEYEIPCCLALGYPAEKQPVIRQVAVNAREKMHMDCWKYCSEDERA